MSCCYDLFVFVVSRENKFIRMLLLLKILELLYMFKYRIVLIFYDRVKLSYI